MSDATRFWAKVQITPGCWEWTAARNRAGYGRLRLGRVGQVSHIYAHRFSYELHNGPIPDDMLVRHSCDNPPCVNPAHLLTGTPADNMRDKAERGRCNPPLGERNPLAKLTADKVREIRASGLSDTKLAAAYGVSQSNISMIRSGRTWKWV